jgi:hypothetical protein
MIDANLTYNITMNITPGSIISLYYYPILFLFLLILPIIIIFIILNLKLSSRIKIIIIFFLNLIFSLFLPILLTVIYISFQTLINLYGQLNLYNQLIFNIMTIQNFMLFIDLISIIYQNIWIFIITYIFTNLFFIIAYMFKKE